MKYICFTILGNTLCGKEDEPVPEHLADSRRFCNDCVQVMWREQYRRRIKSGVSAFSKTTTVVESKTETKVEGKQILRPIKTLRHYMKVKI
tara:strand:- start:3016 stop:3288 length:273 start_codon:yes stop_codon:yes gene_type:complete